MKKAANSNQRSAIIHLLVAVISLFAICHSLFAAAESRTGVLILAHGGSAEWNALVEQAVHQANLPYPTQTAFGMGMTASERERVQEAVSRLEMQGVDRIVAVPLLISSHSSVYRQYEYLLGLRPESSWPDHPVVPVIKKAQVKLGRALDDAQEVADILVERTRELSREPAREAVVLVGHGPEEEKDNLLWIKTMERLAQKLKGAGKFSAVSVATLQDDAPQAVRAQATQRLRQEVSAKARKWRVLVVPLLLSQNGVESKVSQRLSGISYVYAGKTLLPHPAIARWIKKQVSESALTS